MTSNEILEYLSPQLVTDSDFELLTYLVQKTALGVGLKRLLNEEAETLMIDEALLEKLLYLEENNSRDLKEFFSKKAFLKKFKKVTLELPFLATRDFLIKIKKVLEKDSDSIFYLDTKVNQELYLKFCLTYDGVYKEYQYL